MSSKAYQEVYPLMTKKQKDIMYDLCMKAVNHDGHSWNMFCDIEDAVAGIVKAQQWIPCSERNPEKNGFYLVTTKAVGWNCKEYTDVDTSYYGDGIWYRKRVLAWMPLPKPWEGKEQ